VEGSEFQERPTELLVEDAWRLGAAPLALGALCGVLGAPGLSLLFLLLAGFVGFFFRNPDRSLPGGEREVLAPADGRVVEVAEVEEPDGGKALRIGIFLSIFDVHVNRMPVSGRVVAIERGGSAYLAAFNREAAERNVRCSLVLETESGLKVRVTQITGLIARRIVCHPRIGERVRRGERYGLIRFGSRTDVVLPLGCDLKVVTGDRVKGGSSVVAVLGSQP
jgi:phosphatidylserine decarboxylase